MTRTRRAGLLLRASHAVILVVLSASLSSAASAEGLEQALGAAYLSNPDLDAERARLRATDEDVSRAYSGFRPRVEGNAFSGERTYETKPMLPDFDKSTPLRGYQLSVKQPLFRGGRTLSSVSQAQANSESGQNKLRAIEIRTLLSAATAFADVRRDRARLALRRSNVSALQAEVAAAKARLDAQAATIADVAQAEARVAAARAEVDRTIAEVKTSEARYQEVVGHQPGELPAPRDFVGSLLPGSLEQAIAAAQDENPEVLAAVKAEAAAAHNIDTVRGELLPEVSIEGSWTKTFDPESGVDMTDESVVVGRVKMPLYEGGDTYARVRQAKEQHLAAIQDVRSLRNQAQKNVIAAWSRLQSSRAQLSSSQARIAAARKALDGLKGELAIGGRSVIDVLNAQEEVIAAEIADAVVRRDVLVATYEVLASTGALTIERLGITDAVYDAEAHLADVALRPFGTGVANEPEDAYRLPAWMSSGPFARTIDITAGEPVLEEPEAWSSAIVPEDAHEKRALANGGVGTAVVVANSPPTWATNIETGSVMPASKAAPADVWSTSTVTAKQSQPKARAAKAAPAGKAVKAPSQTTAVVDAPKGTAGNRTFTLKRSLD